MKSSDQKALLSIPTRDHYLFLLYVIATKQQGDIITFPIEGVDAGPISMLTPRWVSPAVLPLTESGGYAAEEA
jgi:hypothetical protein